MGLDFGLFYKTKEEKLLDCMNKNELCYGRKSWELVYLLCPEFDTTHRYFYKITWELWENLVTKLDEIGDYLELAKDAYWTYENRPDWLTRDEMEAIKKYEKWYDTNFGEFGGPTLGYYFSISYMQEFYDVRDKVFSLIDDPDFEVWAYVDY